MGAGGLEEGDGFRAILLVRPGERRASLFVLLVNLGAIIDQQLQHLVAGAEMHRHVQTVLPVLALDFVGILSLLEQPGCALDAAARHGTAERRISAVMLGTAGAVEFSAVRKQHLQGVELPVAGGVVDGVVVGAPAPSLQEHLEHLHVVAVDGLIDAAGDLGAVVD